MVHYDWVAACAKAKRFVDESPFSLGVYAKDTRTGDVEQKFDFELTESHERAQSQKFLAGKQIYATKSCKPAVAQLKVIVKSAGGTMRATAPKKFSDKLLVVTCAADKSKHTALRRAGFALHSVELVLTGVLRQRLDLESHLLDGGGPASAAAASSSSTRKRKKR
jgi:hypothetical protein